MPRRPKHPKKDQRKLEDEAIENAIRLAQAEQHAIELAEKERKERQAEEELRRLEAAKAMGLKETDIAGARTMKRPVTTKAITPIPDKMTLAFRSSYGSKRR